MTMSSGGGLEFCTAAQHRSKDVDPPASEDDHRLVVPLTLAPLAVVEGPRLAAVRRPDGTPRKLLDVSMLNALG